MTTALDQPSSTYTDFSHFSSLRAQAHRDQGAAFAQVAKQFEALFIQMMLKSARDATPQAGVFDSNEMDTYREMFDNQVALTMAQQGGLGVKDMLERQLLGASPEAAADRVLTLPERRHYALEDLPYGPAADFAGQTDMQPDSANASLPDGPDELAGNTQYEFARELRAHAEAAAARLGTSADILIAQAALESGWGNHVMRNADGTSSYNLFSIKADPSWDGRTVKRNTLEYYGNKPVHVTAAFRAYDDMGAAFDDYVQFVEGNPRYQRALQQAADPKAYVRELSRAGYATDPNYAQKILEIHKRLSAFAAEAGQHSG